MEKSTPDIFKQITIDDTLVSINFDGTVVYAGGKLIKVGYLKTTKNSKGYRVCKINRKKYYVHKLVALAFVPNPNNYPFAIHHDTDTLNNHYKNIGWGERKHIIQNILVQNKFPSAYPKEDIPLITKLLDDGITARDIAKEYNVSEMTIDRVRRKHCIVKVASVRYPSEIRDAAEICWNYGICSSEIAKWFGIRYETIWKWSKKW